MTELTDKTEEPNPLTKPKFIIAAVVVALIIILGIVLALIPKDAGTPAAPATTSTAVETRNAAASPSADASICGLPAGDQKKPVTAPENAKWELVGKMAAPVSPTQYGPGKTEASGLRHCFAHSPTGALYAAANVTALSAAGKTRLVYEDLAVPGPDRDAILSQSNTSAPSSVTAQIAGFAFRSYGADRAVVDLAFKGDNGTYVSIPVPLQWYGGDWKVIVPATGSTGAKQIADLGGYVPWAGI